MIDRVAIMGITSLTGMVSTTFLGTVDPSALAGFERLGVAAVTIGILMMLFFQERDERRKLSAANAELHTKYRESAEDIRQEMSGIIREHATVVKENSTINAELLRTLRHINEK